MLAWMSMDSHGRTLASSVSSARRAGTRTLIPPETRFRLDAVAPPPDRRHARSRDLRGADRCLRAAGRPLRVLQLPRAGQRVLAAAPGDVPRGLRPRRAGDAGALRAGPRRGAHGRPGAPGAPAGHRLARAGAGG